jgi:hypothetical protein
MFLSSDKGWETPTSENMLIEDITIYKIQHFDFWLPKLYICFDFSPIPTFLSIWRVSHLRNLWFYHMILHLRNCYYESKDKLHSSWY